MSNTASLKKEYAERIAPALKNQFQYSSTMQIPVLKKIVINQGLGMAVADKKIIEVAINELTAITGQKAVATVSRKDIANFKLAISLYSSFKDNVTFVSMFDLINFSFLKPSIDFKTSFLTSINLEK